MKYENILEEEIKNKVTQDFFQKFDCTRILGKIDFAVKVKRPQGTVDFNAEYLLWAEAKQKPTDILVMLTQLVLTVGKARTFDEMLPPKFLGCYDSEKIAFVPYHDVQDIFYQNDFNWNVTPSNHQTREFRQVHAQIKKIIECDSALEAYIFSFSADEKELRRFIHENFIAGNSAAAKNRIDKNNFIIIYSKWLQAVRPTIAVKWEKAKARGIIDGDFYLADLLSAENKTLKEKLFVLLHRTYYEFDRVVDQDDIYNSKRAEFTDAQIAHSLFWAKYERPPKEDYWDYIIERRDLLVPQDVRERKGSFFTPRRWVELSQKYIAEVLGGDWQDEYYVWDCAAGTGNLLAGLTNKYNIWASTLDKQDVDVMRDRIKNGANLLEDHVFQFDFLNDDFSKLPAGLQNIINDETLRKNLIIYINPPYAEGDNVRGLGRKNVQVSKVHDKYISGIAKASGELFAQFLVRIYCEIPTATIANFSTLKNLQAPNYSDFRKYFRAKLEKIFLVPAATFENVSGQFPIGFFVWNTKKAETFEQISADVYMEKNGEPVFTQIKTIKCYDNVKYISDWLEEKSKNISKNYIGHLASVGNDFQNQRMVFIDDVAAKRKKGGRHTMISLENLIEVCAYFTVRKVIPADWLNDRDQFLFPNKKWENDAEFQNDCLTYTLFNNNISSKYGVNHWIPFTEEEVNSRDKFASHFMASFLSGKIIKNAYADLFWQLEVKNKSEPKMGWKKGQKREFSAESQAVFDAGKALWQYYHAQPKSNVNASLYDIREHFQGRNEKGKMNNTSTNSAYSELVDALRSNVKILAKKVEPKVYEYGFLK
ncbi:MAG: hypothetical protein LBL94_08040 [Prevotellaceae bacterium]|jgi:hypothetical protein|nr:hypothetical protein [Prevotellaceae bacterium]